MSQLKIDKSALSAVEGQLKASRSGVVNSLTNIIKVSSSLAATNIFAAPIYMAGVGEDDEPIRDYRDAARSYIKYAKKINTYAKDILNVRDDLTDVIDKINSILDAVDEFEGQSMALDNLVSKSMDTVGNGFLMGTHLGDTNGIEEGVELSDIATDENSLETSNNEEVTGKGVIAEVGKVLNSGDISNTNGKVSENVLSNWNNLEGVSEIDQSEIGVAIKPGVSLFGMNEEKGLGGLAVSLGTGLVGGITSLTDNNDKKDELDNLLDKKISNKDMQVDEDDEVAETVKVKDTENEEEAPIIDEVEDEINVTLDDNDKNKEENNELELESSGETSEEPVEESNKEDIASDNVVLQEDTVNKDNGTELKEEVKDTQEEITAEEIISSDNSNDDVTNDKENDDVTSDKDEIDKNSDIELNLKENDEVNEKETDDVIELVDSNINENKKGMLVTDIIDLGVNETIDVTESVVNKEVPVPVAKGITKSEMSLIPNANVISSTPEIDNNSNFINNSNVNNMPIYNNNWNNSLNGQNIINNNVNSGVNNTINNDVMVNNGFNVNVDTNNISSMIKKPSLGEFILVIVMTLGSMTFAVILKYLDFINYIAFGLLIVAIGLLFLEYLAIRRKKMKTYKMQLVSRNNEKVSNREQNIVGQQVMTNNGYEKTFGQGNFGQGNTLIMNEIEIMQQNQLNGNRQNGATNNINNMSNGFITSSMNGSSSFKEFGTGESFINKND